MSTSDAPPSGGATPPPSVVGEVHPFDPGPSVAAAAAVLEQQGAEFALIGGLALDAWGIPRATKDADFAVPVGAAETAAESLRGPDTEIRPLRIGGVGVRDSQRALRIDLVDRRFHFAALFRDAIREARVMDKKAKEVAKAELDEYLASGYGIFTGRNVQWAKLRFSPRAARWRRSGA